MFFLPREAGRAGRPPLTPHPRLARLQSAAGRCPEVFTLPRRRMEAVVRLLRLALVIAALSAGFFGVGLAICLFLLHISSIDSFGLSYTAPMTDGRPFPLLRLLLRLPKPLDKYRDPNLNTPDKRRQK